uniref:Uncharacterized protein n=1 Tax=Globodera rostochiensis TaxID=31243 RepID=A0A914HA33_GLORO
MLSKKERMLDPGLVNNADSMEKLLSIPSKNMEAISSLAIAVLSLLLLAADCGNKEQGAQDGADEQRKPRLTAHAEKNLNF